MAYADLQGRSDLIYYPDSEPGIRRKRAGRGFSYIAPDGTRIDDKAERARLKSLGVPPAYTDVWICPMPLGHLQATGFDERERKQYRYHPDWTKLHAQLKYDNLIQLSDHLPSLRRWIAMRLRGDAGTFDTALAATLVLIDRASMRVGNAAYTDENGSYGVTTLLNKHVDIDGGHLALAYVGKGGKQVEKDFYAPRLAHVLHDSQDLPGAELISYVDDRGDTHGIRSDHINDALHDICGADVTAKTLRTWNGTHAAFCYACNNDAPTIKAMCEAAALRLHNTAAVSRTSYIHPAVIDLADLHADERAVLFNRLAKTKPVSGLRKGEAELAAYLRGG
ncbi:DNA topoisomerase IB [Loktanella sp. SALINAS62]|uniref:DNA topoisomerase IB n=1 Tax=Loktanella sp. SALINAS62 TaxID=2706124 RepID=UPI001B8C1A81|nr:DNA topoisomerase IB [Loktanella sp. SALINAS62]MBS1302227.1 DNA topoisomerase IB [Loktanella sp. SALINAS62]